MKNFIKPQNKEDVKKFLSQEPQEILVNQITPALEGRYKIELDGVNFESFVMPSEIKKLVVFLGGQGIFQDKTVFLRAAWAYKFEGLCIGFDDPARREFKIAPCWYYGTKDKDYTLLLMKIIKQFCLVNNIHSENVVFVSSSNGGFASIRIAEFFPQSVCLAYNAQIDIETYDSRKKFQFKKTFSIAYQDSNERLSLKQLFLRTKFKKNHTKYFLYFNIRSLIDLEQMQLLEKWLERKLRIGLNRITDDFVIGVASVDAIDAHIAQPQMFSSVLLEDFFKFNIQLQNKVWDSIYSATKLNFELNKEIASLKKQTPHA